MTTFPEYEQYDALGLAELVRSGEISALELVEAAIERIEARNPQINAVIHKMYDEARQVAIKTAVAKPDAPFAGVPFLLKDLLAEYAGAPLRNGSRFFKDYVSKADGPMVQRYKAAGLIVLGKTNTPELGITGVTEPELFGTCDRKCPLRRNLSGLGFFLFLSVMSR